jgi:transposase
LGDFSATTTFVARAYSDDLRGKILRAYERGRLGLEAVAEQFGVSYGYTKKIRRQQLQSGRMERPPQARHGPVSRVTSAVEEQLRSELRRQPDLTLRELAERLEQSRQLRLSRTRLWEVLQRLGLRRKKNRSTPRSRTVRRHSSGGKPGGKR